MISKHHSAARRGVSLVETLVVATITSAGLALTVFAFQGLSRLDARVFGETEFTRSLVRLGHIWRDDLHGAGSAGEVSVEGPRLTRRLADDRQLMYELLEDRVQRTVVEGGQTVHRDRFRLPGARLSWGLSGPDPAPRVALRIERESRAYRLEARVGLESQLAGVEERAEP